MSENSEILTETSLAGLVGARVGFSDPADAYAGIILQIKAKCGDDVATLFAEPVPPSRRDPDHPTLTWYTSLDGQMIELFGIDDVARAPVVNLLKARLQRLKPLLDTPDLGPVVASWLYIPSLKSILSVGGNPVLINWGYLPASVAASPSARDSHFAQTIGRYLPGLTPPFTPEEQASYVGNLTSRKLRSATQAPSTPQTGAGRAPTVTEGSLRGVQSSAGTQRLWVAPLMANLVAAGALAFLSWPGILKYPDNSRDQASLDRDAAALREGNQTLEQKLRQLNDAAQNRACRSPNGQLIPLAPGANGGPQPARPNPLAPSPDRVQVTPPNSTSPTNALQMVDNSVVIVMGQSSESPEEIVTGSGFFIAPNLILTNRHVVEGIADGKIIVTNKSLGRATPASVLIKSPPDPDQERSGMSQPDMAVIQIEGSHSFLKIGPSPAKGSDVWAVGYTGFITQDQQMFRRLVEGDLTAAPDASWQRGIVTTKPEGETIKQLLHSAAISQGNSGGPLVDICGRVVGVNTMVKPNANMSASLAQDPAVVVNFLQTNSVNATVENSGCMPQVAGTSGGSSPTPTSPRATEPTPASAAGP